MPPMRPDAAQRPLLEDIQPMSSLSRSRFLTGLVAGLSACAYEPVLAASQALPLRPATEQHWLFLSRESAGERIYACWKVGEDLQPGYNEVCAIMRDAHVDPALGFVQINPQLLQVLSDLQRYAWAEMALQAQRQGRAISYPAIDVHSAYRTWATNLEVGGVMNSQHLLGKACDFHINNYELGRAHAYLDAHPLTGGLGLYPSFIHIDTRPDRGARWYKG